jgi:hypothetical protein
MQCVLDAILPTCLGGQGARVFWLDTDLTFNARQFGRMVGFEVLVRCASGAFTEAGQLLPLDVLSLIMGADSRTIAATSPASRAAADAAVERVVMGCLANVVVMPCTSTTELMAALAAAEARLSLRTHVWSAVVLDSLSCFQHQWRAHEPMAGTAAYIQLVRTLRRLRKSFGITVFVSRRHAGRERIVRESDAFVASATSGAAAEHLEQAARAAQSTAAAFSQRGDDGLMALPLAGTQAAAAHARDDLPSSDMVAAATSAARSMTAGDKPPWDLAPKIWQQEATHSLRFSRVSGKKSSSWAGPGEGPFAACNRDVFVARLVRGTRAATKLPPSTPPSLALSQSFIGAGAGFLSSTQLTGSDAAALPLLQTWPFTITAAGLVQAELGSGHDE